MRNVSNKSCRENQNTHFNVQEQFSYSRAVYGIMSKNMVETERERERERDAANDEMVACCLLD
jgi:hypothetical protein